MTPQNKKKKILEILKKYYAKMTQIEEAKVRILNDIRTEQTQEDIDKIRQKLQNL